MMLALQAACLVIVAMQVVAGARRSGSAPVYLRRAAIVAAASWIAEDSCIRLYEFYAYSPEWGLFLDRMPVMIAIIWPAVVLSDWELAGHLSPRWPALLTAALVTVDAAFMEPVAVQAGLWRWFEPGFFGVPLIGVAGWGMFAGLCMTLLTGKSAVLTKLRRWPGLVVLCAVVGTHLMLLLGWWGALRWVARPLSAPEVAVTTVLLGATLALLVLRRGWGARVPLGAMLTRVPAAALFFVLLAREAAAAPWLVVHALGFAPPYIALTVGAAAERRRQSIALRGAGGE
jgi:hypothetical protein